MKILSTADIHQDRVKMLVMGPSGHGKTSLAKTLPHDKTLILSAEGGLLSLKGTKIDVLDLTVDDEGRAIPKELRVETRVRQAFEYLNKPETQAQYEYVFIDSLTELAENILESERSRFAENVRQGKAKENDGFAVYNAYTPRFASLVKSFRDLPHYNVIFTALEELDKDNEGRRFYGLDIPGKAAKAFIVPAFDIVLRIAMQEDGKPVLQTKASVHNQVKVRGIELAATEPPDLSLIISKIRSQVGGENQQDKKGK